MCFSLIAFTERGLCCAALHLKITPPTACFIVIFQHAGHFAYLAGGLFPCPYNDNSLKAGTSVHFVNPRSSVFTAGAQSIFAEGASNEGSFGGPGMGSRASHSFGLGGMKGQKQGS